MQPVKMYTTAVCPYCVRAKQILKSKGVEQIEEIRVDLDPEARTHMMEITGRRTVPQIFIGTTHMGGAADFHRHHPCGWPRRPGGPGRARRPDATAGRRLIPATRPASAA